MAITIPLSEEDTRKVSDGYHTFNELYDHRIMLFINLAKASKWKSAWKPHYPGWPVMFLETPAGQISYHFKECYLPHISSWVPRDDNYEWNGHTSGDVLLVLQKVLVGI